MERPIAFFRIRVFDGAAFHEDWDVVAAGASVLGAGPHGEVAVPADADRVAGAATTLLPGFVDAHVHLGLLDPRRVVRSGVTVARDLGWDPAESFRLAAHLASDPAAGPRLLAAGPMITAPGGYPIRAGWAPPGTGLPVGDPGEAAAAVHGLAARGAAVVKVAQEPRAGPTLPSEVLSTVVREAHAAGLRVTSHIDSLAELEKALAAGVDEAAHGLWSEEEIPESVARRMAAAGMVVVPTLHIHPSRARLSSLRRFLASGGRVVYGTDMGNAGPPPGIDPEELALMEASGMTREAALAAATSGAASHLGLARNGRIGPGATANLVLVEGDPRHDLGTLGRPVLVMHEGMIVQRVR